MGAPAPEHLISHYMYLHSVSPNFESLFASLTVLILADLQPADAESVNTQKIVVNSTRPFLQL
jgi:hypothetical protein